MKTRSGNQYSSLTKKSTFKRSAKCSICVSSKNLLNFVRPVHKCKGEKLCCKTCFGKYVEMKLSTTGFPILCMFVQCKTELAFMEIYNYLPDSRTRGILQKTSLDKQLASKRDFPSLPATRLHRRIFWHWTR